jgi:hypothetical protein
MPGSIASHVDWRVFVDRRGLRSIASACGNSLRCHRSRSPAWNAYSPRPIAAPTRGFRGALALGRCGLSGGIGGNIGSPAGRIGRCSLGSIHGLAGASAGSATCSASCSPSTSRLRPSHQAAYLALTRATSTGDGSQRAGQYDPVEYRFRPRPIVGQPFRKCSVVRASRRLSVMADNGG